MTTTSSAKLPFKRIIAVKHALRSLWRGKRRAQTLAALGLLLAGGLIGWLEYPRKPVPVPITSRYPQSTLAMRTPGRVRVLFIGNSLTEYNGGLATTMDQLAASARIKPTPVFDEVTKFGATWAQLWDLGKARDWIHQGGWDYVVLQDYSTAAIVYPSEMQVYARRFSQEVQSVGAKPVFFMTWPHKDRPETGQPIAAAYMGVAADNHGIAAPVAWAWKKVLREHPQLILYDPKDNPPKHPTPAGTYLTACVFYSIFFHRSPHGLTGRVVEGTNVYVDLTPSDARILQDAAWSTVKDFAALSSTQPATQAATKPAKK